MSVKSYKTADGKVRWYAYFRYTDWTGERRAKKKMGFNLKREAQEYEREFLLRNEMKCDMSFASLVELYREDSVHRVRVSTGETNDSIIEKWLLPFFGNLSVDSISPAVVRKWQNEMMGAINPRNGQKYSETYLRTINSKLSAIFNYAVKYCGLPVNPCVQAGSMGKKKSPKMKFWTTDEFNRVIAEIDKWSYRLAFMILYWLGLRVGECLDLRPSDFHDDIVHIDKTYHRRGGEDVSGPPKTENSRRDVVVPSFLSDEIQRYIGALYEIADDERIFYFTKSALNRELERAANAAGVKNIRVHDLRHSHAALLVELGYSPVAIAERLGDTVTVAMGTYAHLYPQKMKRLAEELDDLANRLDETEKGGKK